MTSRVSFETVNHGIYFEQGKGRGNSTAPIHVGDRVWIGAGVTILPGIRIGNDAVVAAGAVVTKDVAERTLVGGVPAKLIRSL